MGRFFGLLTTASNLGIIGKKKLTPVPRRQATAAAKAAGAARQEYRLGNGLTEYEVLDPSESKCDKFLEATRAEEPGLATPSDAGASTPCALHDLVDYGTRRARGNCTATAWQLRNNCMAHAWQWQGKRMATAWQLHGNHSENELG